jgi:hypothetical protein
MVVETLLIILVIVVAWGFIRGKGFEIKIIIEHKQPQIPLVDLENMKRDLTQEEDKFYKESQSIIGVINGILSGTYKDDEGNK